MNSDARRSRDFQTIPPELAEVLRHFAGACHVPREELDDLVQDVYVRILPRFAEFCTTHAPEVVARWLYRVVHNEAIDHIRKKARHPVRRLSEALAARVAGRDTTPDEAAERREREEFARNLLARIRNTLSEESLRILDLLFVQERTVLEIATELGLTPNEVRCRKYRLLKKIRQLLGGGLTHRCRSDRGRRKARRARLRPAF